MKGLLLIHIYPDEVPAFETYIFISILP